MDKRRFLARSVIMDRVSFSAAAGHFQRRSYFARPAAADTGRDPGVFGEGVDHAASLLTGSSVRSSGSGRPSTFATRRKCAKREAGIPIFRQLWTVETGASISRAVAVVPPR